LTRITSQRRWRWGALLLLLATLPAVPGYARTHRGESHHGEAWARERFATAERMREALNGRPPADRTRHDYQRVINAYRSVYYGAPTSTKADPSVVSVAETLVEMGRRFNDDKILNEAIAQYKFLRKEYPGSKYRCDALFTIGEIYSDDLNDPERARATFTEFLHRYPHNRLVEDAQQAIVELDRQAEAEKKAETATNSEKDSGDRSKAANGKDSARKDPDSHAEGAAGEENAASAQRASTRLPRVTGIRHWSTPDYTRVAIDLESDVKFASQRISHPDRIFFDLRGTKLASTLVGKSFDVDDGFLKKIRVAQFQPGRTRVVLEVDNLSDYDAFLLPNPYRLIIDIHGKDGDIHAKDSSRSAHLNPPAETATDDVEVAPKAGPADALPKSELKADTKDVAGEAVSKKEQIHDQTKTEEDTEEAKDEDDSAVVKPRRTLERSTHPKTREVEVKTPTGTIKKVIVYADDDDDSAPADGTKEATKEMARVEPPAIARSSSAVSRKGDSVNSESGKSDSVDSDNGNSDAVRRDNDNSDAVRPDNPGNSGDAGSVDASATPAKSHSRAQRGGTSSRKSAGLDAREARPTARGDRSLIRVLGLKIGKIVIDPGHGGHDTGTIGPDGLEEKDVVLDVGKRLGRLLETRLGAEVVYTRKDDTFIPLETRTAIANQQRADLFISIHANSSQDPTARGVETYYLNFTSSPDALEVAARENAVSEKSIYELQDLVKKIALKEKIEESREFAGDVQESLHSGLAAKSPAIRDRGVKKAPFIVLIGANMPSILAEISFVSNPTDERRLETSEYRQRIAESLYRGIAKYVNGLSGVKVASNKDKSTAQ
jgi:N-acetylmuramoyl-L-alanine amidase